MQIKGLRLYVVIAAVVITLGILLAAQFIHQKYNVEQPLFKLYSQTKLVRDVKIDDKGSTVKVILDVKKTDNLQRAYHELNSYTEQIMGNSDFKIVMKDKRNKVLEDAYYRSQFAVYEALAKGDFTRMAETIERNAQKAGAEAKIFIDGENIYVEFLKGDAYLYEIIPRENQAIKDPLARMGSDSR